MDGISEKILLALLGGFIGFALKWALAERQEWMQLRRSIAPLRAEAYRELWALCRPGITPEMRTARATELDDWYQKGGGLFLSLAASRRYFGAVGLLGKSMPSEAETKELQEDLSWLRTELKCHVGSYSRREAKTRIPTTR